MSRTMGIGTSELVELLTAFIVLAAAFSIIQVHGNINYLGPDVFLVSGLGVGSGFLLHELAHKFVAQRYGYWAEFKLWFPGLILTLVMSFMGFIIAMPGAVMIHKPYYSRQSDLNYSDNDAYWDSLERRVGNEELWISLAGPVTNIILAAFFFSVLMSGLVTDGLLSYAVYYALYINLILAAFNLLPINPMDGYKIFRSNALIWVVIAVPVILIALGFMFGVISIF